MLVICTWAKCFVHPARHHPQVYSYTNNLLGFQVKSDYESDFEKHVCDTHVGQLSKKLLESDQTLSLVGGV